MASALVGVLAIAALWREASVARARLLVEADRRAAAIAAGYLSTVIAPTRASYAAPDARLLSAAGALADANYWPGGIQVWLRGVPLLPGDTAGTHAMVATLPTTDTLLASQVAVWATVAPGIGIPGLVIGTGLAILALITAILAGEFVRERRRRALIATIGLVVVAVGAIEQYRAVRTVQRATIDAGLLGVRRSLEVATMGRRLNDGEVAAIGADARVTPLEGEPELRDPGVVRDTLGAHAIAVASVGQQWRIDLQEGEATVTMVWRALFFWGMVALVAGFVGAALPPSAGYLSSSRTAP